MSVDVHVQRLVRWRPPASPCPTREPALTVALTLELPPTALVQLVSIVTVLSAGISAEVLIPDLKSGW